MNKVESSRRGHVTCVSLYSQGWRLSWNSRNMWTIPDTRIIIYFHSLINSNRLPHFQLERAGWQSDDGRQFCGGNSEREACEKSRARRQQHLNLFIFLKSFTHFRHFSSRFRIISSEQMRSERPARRVEEKQEKKGWITNGLIRFPSSISSSRARWNKQTVSSPYNFVKIDFISPTVFGLRLSWNHKLFV